MLHVLVHSLADVDDACESFLTRQLKEAENAELYTLEAYRETLPTGNDTNMSTAHSTNRVSYYASQFQQCYSDGLQ